MQLPNLHCAHCGTYNVSLINYGQNAKPRDRQLFDISTELNLARRKKSKIIYVQ